MDELMREARSWVAECVWGEDQAELDELSDVAVRRGVAAHYEGGWAGFVQDSTPKDQRRVTFQGEVI